MAANGVDLLRANDPARVLAPLSAEERLACRRAATRSVGTPRRARRLRLGRLAFALAVLLLVATGVAWAAGAVGPLALFEKNPEADGSPAGGLWDQRVIPASVADVASIRIPGVGPVQFFYGRSAQGGWCAALRLPSRKWLGTGADKFDAGGTVPGCFPTREMVNGATNPPVYVLTGFDYVEDDIDARSAGGQFWRIHYGRITAPGAVRVEDLVTGRSAAVVRKGLFLLAVPDPAPTERNEVHLVAYNDNGKVVADDCPNCSSG